MPPDPSPVSPTDDILDNLLDAVLVVDSGGKIIYANRSAQRLFQKSPAQLLEHAFGFPVLLYEVQEIQLLKGGTLLTVQMLASSIEWNRQPASLVSLRDITAQKKLMEELEEGKKLLEKMNEENAQFASMAAHDLKEPVRKILLFSDLLMRTGGRPPADDQKIAKINASARRMSQLISGIAELSRVSYVEQRFEGVNLRHIVTEVCEDLEFLLRDHAADVDIGDLPHLEAVPDKMYQLFLNLMSNSIKYARKGVPPNIRIAGRPARAGWVEVTVQDNGIGFESALSTQLFQPFRRLHKGEYEGVGVGLSLCQRIVELHGGSIRADGAVDQGATFTILLPLTQAGLQG